MDKTPRNQGDVNQTAARIVRESTGPANDTPADVEKAWAEWSRQIKNVDERTMTLLKAAFEAGANACKR